MMIDKTNVMRAKMVVTDVKVAHASDGATVQEELFMQPVGPKGAYPEDGSDENNSYARWSPSGDLRLVVANPALFGQFQTGQEFYLDFTSIKKLEEWQERVIEEKAELDERLAGLEEYIGGEQYAKLGEEERALLLKQKKTMVAYAKALGERIAKF